MVCLILRKNRLFAVYARYMRIVFEWLNSGLKRTRAMVLTHFGHLHYTKRKQPKAQECRSIA